MINYSFIIPHKNTPILLNRCLDSIPQRDDVEIVVVDDNSDQSMLPYVKRDDVRILFLSKEESNGAGYARNVGLSHVSGDWIVFSDADDFFVPGFLDHLDKYLNSDYDVVYHPAVSVDSQTLEAIPRLLSTHNMFFEKYNGDKYSTDQIKYRLHSPWWKMVKREFIDSFGIQFETVPKGNDVFFTYQVGYLARKVAIEKEPIYVHTYYKYGISFGKKNFNIRKNGLAQVYKINCFYEFVGYQQWKKSVVKFYCEIIRNDGIWLFSKVLYYHVFYHCCIKTTEFDYVNKIKNMYNTNRLGQ